ncbi:MAG: single-stranded DNA-binding protein [Anaerolineales bacterium]|nr:single-stranded DNA-binding protein [Anaerolineales bacterium]
MSYQKLMIVGNLGRDPEMRYLESGQAVTNFNLASNRQYTAGNGERVKETTWFRVTVWGRQAETCNEYLRSGSQVLIEGRLNPDRETGGPRVYQRNDGGYGSSYEVTAERVVFLTRAGAGGPYDDNQGAPAMDDDEIPF